MKLTARVACKSMDRAQEQQYLAQANGHIAELKVQIVRQRVIVKYAHKSGKARIAMDRICQWSVLEYGHKIWAR